MPKKPIPPEDVIREESEPPITETEEPPKENPDMVEVDDDSQTEEGEDRFRKSPQPVKAPKRRKKA